MRDRSVNLLGLFIAAGAGLVSAAVAVVSNLPPWGLWAAFTVGIICTVAFVRLGYLLVLELPRVVRKRQAKRIAAGEPYDEKDRRDLYRSALMLSNRFIDLRNACQFDDEPRMFELEKRFGEQLDRLEERISASHIGEAKRYSTLLVPVRMAFMKNVHIFNRCNDIHPPVDALHKFLMIDQADDLRSTGVALTAADQLPPPASTASSPARKP